MRSATATTVDTEAKLSKVRVTRLSENAFQDRFFVMVFLPFPCILLSLSPIFSVSYCICKAMENKLFSLIQYNTKNVFDNRYTTP